MAEFGCDSRSWVSGGGVLDYRKQGLESKCARNKSRGFGSFLLGKEGMERRWFRGCGCGFGGVDVGCGDE